MADASLLGTVGQFSLSEETGMIIDSIDFDYSDEEVPVLNPDGYQIGGAYTAEKCEFQVEALIAAAAATPFDKALNADLALANAMPAEHFNVSTAAGRTLLRGVKRSKKKKEFQPLSFNAVYHPLMGAGTVLPS